MQRIAQILRHPAFVRTLEKIDQLEQKRIYCRHGMQHLLDVARICYILCLENQISVSKPQVYAAALLHDIGRAEEISGGKPHQLAGAALAAEILDDCGFGQERDAIVNAILGHRKKDLLQVSTFEDALCEADRLSRMCFRCSAQDTCNWTDARRNHTITL
ncbi:MAG: HD domain-containing protein [Butyricicoccaceae bacterium]